MTLATTGRVTGRLVRVSSRRPWLTVAVSLLLAALATWHTARTLDFKPDTLDLLPRDASYVERWRHIEQAFGQFEDIVVVVEAPAPAMARAYVERLAAELSRAPVGFARIAYRVDPALFERQALLYLSIEELEELRTMLGDLTRFAARPELPRLIEMVDAHLARTIAGNFLDLGLGSDHEPIDPEFLHVLLEQIDTRLQGSAAAPYRSPWAALLPRADQPGAGYFTSDDGRLHLVLVEAPLSDTASFTMDRAAMESIRATIGALQPAFPDVNAGVTGAAALAHDEMTTALRDSRVAIVLAFALILGVMTLAFQRLVQPLVMLGVLAVSLTWALGAATVLVGHLTLFSVMFISVVAGIGVDYGIYLMLRYEDERRAGRSRSEALETTATRTGPLVVLSALTAGGAFYVLGLTDFPGIQELGIIAGTAILLACLAMLTLLPAVLVLVDRPRPEAVTAPGPRALERLHTGLTERLGRRAIPVLGTAGVLTALAVAVIPSVGLDYNLLNLQAPRVESVIWQRRLQSSDWRSGPSALTSAGSLEELRRMVQAFERLPTVYDVESLLQVVPDRQTEKVAMIRGLAPLANPSSVLPPGTVDVARLERALAQLTRRLAILANEAPDDAGPELTAMHRRADDARRRLQAADPAHARAALDALQREIADDVAATLRALADRLDPRPVGLDDVPEAVRARYVGRDGRFLVQIHPRDNVWERAGAEAFVRDVRSVDEGVTGAVVISHEAIVLMERAYRQGTLYAYALVGALSLAMIRRLRDTALALLPLVVGMVWTLGLMHVVGLSFTLANIFALPFLVGACAEFGLSIVLSHLEERERGGPVVARAAGVGVMVNGLTTLAGFGSLMVARHQGIFGLGVLLALGAATRLAATLVVLPAILARWPARARLRPGRASADGTSTDGVRRPAPPGAGASARSARSRGEGGGTER